MPRAFATPQWMLDVISLAAPSIVSLHGADMLPASPDVLGCGCFGCVFETIRPGWVLKVSLDGSEAFFARCQVNIGRAPPGVCKYLQPLKVGTVAGPVWIMWKQRAEMPPLDEWLSGRCRPPANLEDKWDEMLFASESSWQRSQRLRKKWKHERGCDALDQLDAIYQCGMGIAIRFAYFCGNVGQPADFANVLRNRRKDAEAIFRPRWHIHSWRYHDLDDPEIWLDTAVDLLGYEFQINELRRNKLVSEIASALSMYLRKGLVVGDPQPDNVARVNGVWSVFDLGFTVPIHPRWEPAWMDEDVRPERWDANERIRVWRELEGG